MSVARSKLPVQLSPDWCARFLLRYHSQYFPQIETKRCLKNPVLPSTNSLGGIYKNRKTIPTSPIQISRETRVMLSDFNDPLEYKTVSGVDKQPMSVVSTGVGSFFSFFDSTPIKSQSTLGTYGIRCRKPC